MSLIELSLVLVVMGFLVGAGLLAWSSFIETRRMAKTASTFYEIKDCLMRRAVFSQKYPDYSQDLDCAAVPDPDTMDVDACLCERDARRLGQKALFSSKESPEAASSSGRFIVEDDARGQDSTAPTGFPGHGHQGGDPGGRGLRPGQPGQGRVGRRPELPVPGDRVGPIGQLGDFSPHPDFSNTRDDVVVIVTSGELLGIIDE